MVTNTKTDEVTTFLSQSQAAKYLDISASTRSKYLEANLPYKEYLFTLISSSSTEMSGEIDRSLPKEKVVHSTGHSVLVVNNETGESREFYSVTEAAKELSVSIRLLT